MKKKSRAFFAGFFNETNTYVQKGTKASFTRTTGQENIDQNRGNNRVFGAYIDYCDQHDIEIVSGPSCMGNPCGLLIHEDYRVMRADIMDAAKQADKIDLLMPNFHGAACVEGVADPELDIVTGLKEIVGDEVTVLALGMDLHGKCSDGFDKACALISSVHTYPHEALSYLEGRITVDPDLCNGRPTIRGLRITVETVLGFLSAGESRDEILDQYPSLEAADIEACLRFAANMMAHRYTLQHVA